MAFDPDAYLQSVAPAPTTASPPPTFDPDKYLQSVAGVKQQPTQAPAKPINRSFLGIKYQVKPGDFDLMAPGGDINPTGITGTGGAGPVGGEMVSGIAGAIGGGLKGLWDLALGRSGEEASSDVGKTQEAVHSVLPNTPQQQGAAAVAASNANPLNWIPNALDATGRGLADISEAAGAPAGVQTALRVAPTAAATLFGLKGMKGAPDAESEGINASGFENEEGIKPTTPQEPAKPPVDITTPKEDMTPAQQTAAATERQNILQRVGIVSGRDSAINAEPKDAATDFQMTKYDQPAGREMAAQFEHEKDTMAAHAEGIVNDTGGTTGLDEDSLANRGGTIAQPFDQLRQWFEQRTKQLYSQAQQRSEQLSANGNPTALTDLGSVQAKLSDPTFVNTLLAKDQGGLLKSMQSQLQNFRSQNPNGFSPAAAEQFRQWLNQIWTPDNRYAIGQIKEATDNDVLNSAGEDIYGPARAISILKKQTLDNPNGVSDLFDTDSTNPINRSTPYEKIPDKLARLPIAQFQNVLDTLKGMPDELQDSAQGAIGEIKAHLANKLLQAGSQTRSGAARNLWNGDAVNNVLSTNGAKFKAAFGDDPKALGKIKDLKQAGDILKVDTSYPGADAQAANAMKRGILSRAITGASRAGGAALGSGFGGIGAGVGEMAGGAIGESVAFRNAESAALKAVQKRIKRIGPK